MKLKVGGKYVHKGTGTEVEILSLLQRTEVSFELLAGKRLKKDISKERFEEEFKEK